MTEVINLLNSAASQNIDLPDAHRWYAKVHAAIAQVAGQLNNKTGAWPNITELNAFEQFCLACYQETLQIIERS
ncbi:hypothetical protein [Thalassotalea agariperforans]